jgi:hypothetical protein
LRSELAATVPNHGEASLPDEAKNNSPPRRPENADLVPIVADMRRALGTRFKRKVAPDTPTAPVEDPAAGHAGPEDHHVSALTPYRQ